jgi:cytochrome c
LIASQAAQGEIMQRATSSFVTTSTLVAAVCAVAVLSVGARSSLAAGDPEAGRQVFARCGVCHATEPGVNKVGPSLAGVVGRKSGSAGGYEYSAAMKDANITWDNDTLDQFLAGPGNFLHGTKMFLSVANSTERQNVISYLDTLKSP